MSGHQNVIELNGKLYDTKTGTVLDSKPTGPVIIKPQGNGVVLDGFIRKPSSHAKSEPKPKLTKKVSARQTAAQHVAAHSPHRSKTLMRRGLKKPVLHTTPVLESAPVPDETTLSHDSRHHRAKSVAKSPRISKFGSMLAQPHTFVKKTAPLPVKPAPAHKDHHKALVDHRRAVAHQAATSAHAHNKAVKEKLVAEAIKQARVPQTHHKARKHHVAHKLGISPKLLHVGTSALVLLLIFGFVAYQNAANVSMRIAATRAGFNAAMPGYRPSGFGLKGPIEYGPGQVTLNFKSNSDQRNFHVTQRVSNWNSEALLANFVNANNKSYQTYQDKGRTIYMYDGSNATWVSEGVWYQIEGNSSLTSDQLLRVAASM